MKAEIRKMVVQVDETHRAMGQPIDPPTRRAVAIAVIANPFAGRYAENLDALIDIGEELGKLLGDQLQAEGAFAALFRLDGATAGRRRFCGGQIPGLGRSGHGAFLCEGGRSLRYANTLALVENHRI